MHMTVLVYDVYDGFQIETTVQNWLWSYYLCMKSSVAEVDWSVFTDERCDVWGMMAGAQVLDLDWYTFWTTFYEW